MKKFNIIVPTIKVDAYVLNFLKFISKQNCRSFYITIVANNKSKNMKKIHKYKNCKIILTKKNNISHKRNIGSKCFKVQYLAFFDSDTFPEKNWLNIAEFYLQSYDAVGGPSIPFPKTKGLKKVCHYAKRSFFTTGLLNFRKYKSKSRTCDWIESCNFAIKQSVYLKLNGMNEKIFTAEDKNFFEDAAKKIKNFKVFFHPDLFVYHDERTPLKFFLQRMIFGTAIFDLIRKNKIKDYIVFIPAATFFLLILILKESLKYGYQNLILLSICMIIFSLIYFEISNYVKPVKERIQTVAIIILANISFVIGNLISIFGLKKIFQNYFYKRSRNTW